MIRRPPRSTPLYSSAASDVYKRQVFMGRPDKPGDDDQRGMSGVEYGSWSSPSGERRVLTYRDLFTSTAARMSALKASASMSSPSWMSMARLVLPSRLALN